MKSDALAKRAKLDNRIAEIDIIRGIAVVLMVFDHLMFDLWGLLPSVFSDYPSGDAFWVWAKTVSFNYWVWDVRVAVRNVVVFAFLALTGISCSFSKSNIKRGGMLMGVALFLTAATFVAGKIIGDMDIVISFGILHLIALSILFVATIELFTKNKWVFLALSAVMIAVGAVFLKEIPVSYGSGNFFELFFKQFIGLVLLGPDGYSFLFYGGQVVFGVFLGKLLYPERKPLVFKKRYINNPITFIGRHSLIVYVAHQAVLPVILSIALLIGGHTLAL